LAGWIVLWLFLIAVLVYFHLLRYRGAPDLLSSSGLSHDSWQVDFHLDNESARTPIAKSGQKSESIFDASQHSDPCNFFALD
jgi:hypothetical protein